ncbi:drs2 neo1 protein [Dispira simplex]|nr:drs2 neo1 protein [Dispira simplex]
MNNTTSALPRRSLWTAVCDTATSLFRRGGNNKRVISRGIPLPGSKASGRPLTSQTEVTPSDGDSKSNVTTTHHQPTEFINNTIITTRHSLWNFFPRQLYAQFSNIANLYFLFIAALQQIPGWSPTGQFTTLAPLCVFITIAIAHEAYDDWRRLRQDKVENRKTAWVFHPTHLSLTEAVNVDINADSENKSNSPGTEWKQVFWQHIQVGNVVCLRANEWIPADMVVLASSDKQGQCYVETAALDGETTLKLKQALKQTQKSIGNARDLVNLQGAVHAECPNPDLYSFEGSLELPGASARVPIVTQQVILRGSILRNTDYVYALVLYTGEETKYRLNASKNARTKIPSLRRRFNHIVVMVLILLLLLTVLLTVLASRWESWIGVQHWYLPFRPTNGEPGVTRGDFAARVFGFLILLNTMIPISLYVTMEIVKVGQVYFINHDVEMYDTESDTHADARTSVINEELGQVSYVFSDKTGTLTENKMLFKALSFAGQAYVHASKMGFDGKCSSPPSTKKDGESGFRVSEDTLMTEKAFTTDKPFIQKEPSKIDDQPRPSSDPLPPTTALQAILDHHTLLPSFLTPFSPPTGSLPLDIQDCDAAYHAHLLLMSMALCHTVTPERDLTTGELSYPAVSPDEKALVTGAHELGYILVDRTVDTLHLRLPNVNDSTDSLPAEFHQLDIIEFSSKRKRMSMLIRCPDGQVVLICKGADTVVMDRLTQESQQSETMKSALTHLNRFASQGLRTLLYAFRLLSEEEYTVWHETYIQASTTLVNRQSEMERVAELVEKDLCFCGVTAIEDKLQDQVPDTISKLRRAGMKIWMLTGDKAETAVNIGYGCQLIDQSSQVVMLSQHYCGLYDHHNVTVDPFSAADGSCDSGGNNEQKSEKLIQKVGQVLQETLTAWGEHQPADREQVSRWDRFKRYVEDIAFGSNHRRQGKVHARYNTPVVEQVTTGGLSTDLPELNDKPISEHLNNGSLATLTTRSPSHYAIVVDGTILALLETHPKLLETFLKLGMCSHAVLCCRVSPAQKAMVVREMRTMAKGHVTLAIGDGANDIAMIQEAHVGIGIAGREGLQAARSSDYSIGQFRFLQRLLLIHGRWSYVRLCRFVHGTFYKCFAFYLTQSIFQHFTCYSGTSLYESWTLSMYNTLFASLPVIAIGIFDQDLPASLLLRYPELYAKMGPANRMFNVVKFLRRTMFPGALHALLVIGFPLLYYGGVDILVPTNTQSFTETLFHMEEQLFSPQLHAVGVTVYTSMVLLVTIKLCYLDQRHITWISHGAAVLSVSAWFIWQVVYSTVYPVSNTEGYEVYFAFQQNARNPSFWLIVLITVAIPVLGSIAIRALRIGFGASPITWTTVKQQRMNQDAAQLV